MMNNSKQVRRGDIYVINTDVSTLGEKCGSEQGGVRLGIIVQNDRGNKASSTTIICPLTSRHKKQLPTHHILYNVKYPFLDSCSVVLAEQIQTIDKSRLIKYIGSIDEDDMMMVDSCLIKSLELEG